MHKIWHRWDHRGPDWMAGSKIPGVTTYKVTVWRRWQDFFKFSYGFGLTTVNVAGECLFTTDKMEPYQPNRGKITIDGIDLLELLEQQSVKGRVTVVATIPWPINRDYGEPEFTDQACRVFVGFTHKKSALMAKLALS